MGFMCEDFIMTNILYILCKRFKFDKFPVISPNHLLENITSVLSPVSS